jgi:hypothetical protein
MRESADFDPAEFNTADIIALVLTFIGLGCGVVGAARDASTLMLAAVAFALPATILKVGSTRVKSRRWHQLLDSRGKARDGNSADAAK